MTACSKIFMRCFWHLLRTLDFKSFPAVMLSNKDVFVSETPRLRSFLRPRHLKVLGERMFQI